MSKIKTNFWSRLHREFPTDGIIAIAMLAVIVMSVEYFINTKKEDMYFVAGSDTKNLMIGFEENILGVIQSIDQTLLFVRYEYEKDPEHFDASLLKNKILSPQFSIHTSIVDADGNMKYDSLPGETRTINVKDDDFFQYHENNKEDNLYIGKPFYGPLSKKMIVVFSRKLTSPDGKFAGIVNVVMDPSALSSYYASLQLGSHGNFLLSNLDGAIIASTNYMGDIYNKNLTLQNYTPYKLALDGERGTIIAKSPIDGESRVTSFKKIENVPMILYVGLSEKDILASYAKQESDLLGFGFKLSLLAIMIATLSALHRSKLSKTQKILQATMENLQQGIMMIDDKKDILLMNSKLVDMVHIPSEMAKKTKLSFDKLISYQISQGEFTQDDADRFASNLSPDGINVYERRTNEGRWLEVRTTSLDGGGAVKTFSDVTERKNYEVELKRARDEAQLASRARSEFLAMMSHEIRTPMNGVIGMSGMLLETPLNEEQKQYTDTIKNAGEHLMQILNLLNH